MQDGEAEDTVLTPCDRLLRLASQVFLQSGEEQTTVRAMNEEQAARLLRAARPDRYYALWAVLLTGGLRPSEALGLQWSAVNLDEGKIHVARSLSRRLRSLRELWRTAAAGWKLVKLVRFRRRPSHGGCRAAGRQPGNVI